MNSTDLSAVIALLFSTTLVSCSTVETIPVVRVLPNSSGIEAGAIESHGTSYSIGYGGTVDGLEVPHDVPARVTVEIQRVRALHNKEPRFFTPASGLLQVTSVEHYAEYPMANAGETLEQWRELLDPANPSSDVKAQEVLGETRLAEIPPTHGGRIFHSRVRRKSFPWGEAVLFLTTYVQGGTGGPVNNDMLVLVAQGLTKDGKHAVKAHFEIHHAELPNSMWDKNLAGKKVFAIDSEGEEAGRWLDSQPDRAFTPTFDQYEQFLSSLSITSD